MVYFSVLDKKKSKSNEGGGEKTLNLYLGKLMRVAKLKKHLTNF